VFPFGVFRVGIVKLPGLRVGWVVDLGGLLVKEDTDVLTEVFFSFKKIGVRKK